MTMANATSKQRSISVSYYGERRGSSSSTAASSSMDSTPESLGKAALTAPMAPIYAEELANRLIAFAQKGAEGRLIARTSSNPDVPPSGLASGLKGNPPPPPILKPSTASARPGINVRSKVPPPPPPPRNRQTNSHAHDDVETLSLGMTPSSLADVKSAKHQPSNNSEFNNCSSSLFKRQQSINDDFNGTSVVHFNASSTSLSISRDFNKSTLDHELVARKIRVTQFNDEPERYLESAESLPSTCDKKGRCIRHSSVRLYKKQLLGGFNLVLESCPLCVDETGTDDNTRHTSLSRPTILIKRSASADRRRSRSMERKSSCEYIRSSSLERKVSLLKNSPTSPMRPTMSRSAASENDACTRLPNSSSFLEDKRSKYLEIGPSSEYLRSLSSERSVASSRGSPIAASRPKLSRKALSESDTTLHPPSESPFIRDDQGSKSILERGLEKLSLLHGKDRSSSRHRGRSDVASNKSSSHSKTDAVSVHSSHHGEKSKPKRQFDSTGRCKKHPSVILARKKPFSKGWDMIRDSCPFCEEAGSEISASKMKSLLVREKGGAATNNDFHTSYQSVASSSSCVRSNTDVARRRNSLEKFDYPHQPKPRKSKEGLPVDRMPTDTSRVQKMPYTTPWGEAGWYTGEIDETGIPHGQGRMRFKTGYVFDGSWINGYSEQYLEKQKRIKSGFGTNVAPWKQNATSPHYEASLRLQPLISMGSASSEVPTQFHQLQYHDQMQYSNSKWPSQYRQQNAEQSPGRYPYTN